MRVIKVLYNSHAVTVQWLHAAQAPVRPSDGLTFGFCAPAPVVSDGGLWHDGPDMCACAGIGQRFPVVMMSRETDTTPPLCLCAFYHI